MCHWWASWFKDCADGAGPEAVRQEGPARVVFRRGAGNGGLPNPVLCRGGTHDPLLPGALMERLGGAGARVVPGETPGPSAFGWPHPQAGGGPLLLAALQRDELRAAVGGGTHAYAIAWCFRGPRSAILCLRGRMKGSAGTASSVQAEPLIAFLGQYLAGRSTARHDITYPFRNIANTVL